MNDGIYIKVKGDERGPYTPKQVRSMWSMGVITCDSLFRDGASKAWQPILDWLDSEEGPPPGQPLPQGRKSPSDSEIRKAAASFTIAGLIFAMAVLFLGNVHIITGSQLDAPLIVKKRSFGLSETFVNVDRIAGMPWFSARSRFPLSCAILQREHLIEPEAAPNVRGENMAADPAGPASPAPSRN
jgi:hypothetical protein